MSAIRRTSAAANSGYIAITSLLVISAVVLSIAISTSLLGVGEANTSLTFRKGKETLVIADSCTEISLLKLRNNQNYSGETLNVSNGSCTITISGSNPNFTINSVATINMPPLFVKRYQSTVKRAGNNINLLTNIETP